MKGMASAKESRPCPPNGRYAFNITAATAGFTSVKNEGQANQKGGDSCIELSLELAEGEFAGYPVFDTLGTDGGTAFGGMSKKRLRALEVQGLDSDAEIPDEIIAQSLRDRRVFAEVEREPRMKKNEATGKYEAQFEVDEKTGAKIPLYRLKVVGYLRQPAAGAQVQGQPGMQLQGVPAGLPGGLPQGAPGLPQQQAAGLPPGFPTTAPGQGFPGAPGMPGGYPPGVPGGVPGGYPGAPGGYAAPQGMPGGFPQVQAPAGWTQAPNGVAQAGAPAIPGQQQLPGVAR